MDIAADPDADLRLPDEAAGIERIALVRHPDFAKKVRSIVVEFGSTTEQPTLDRYIRGERELTTVSVRA